MQITKPMQNLVGISGPEASPISLIELIAKGLPFSAFERVVSYAAGSKPATPEYTRIAKRIIPKATMSRRLKDGQINMREGEIILRLVNILQLSVEVWGDIDTAREFLNRNNATLQDRKPIDLVLDSEIGAALVYDLLGKLQYGSAA